MSWKNTIAAIMEILWKHYKSWSTIWEFELRRQKLCIFIAILYFIGSNELNLSLGWIFLKVKIYIRWGLLC